MKILKQIFCTKIGWFFLSWLLFTVSLYLNTPDWFQYILLIYPVGLVAVAIAYAWVINPLRDRKK